MVKLSYAKVTMIPIVSICAIAFAVRCPVPSSNSPLYLSNSADQWEAEINGMTVLSGESSFRGDWLVFVKEPSRCDKLNAFLRARQASPSVVEKYPLLDGDPAAMQVLAILAKSKHRKAKLVGILGLRNIGNRANGNVRCLLKHEPDPEIASVLKRVLAEFDQENTDVHVLPSRAMFR